MFQILLISILHRLVALLQAAFAAKPKLNDDFFHAGFGRGNQYGTGTGSNNHNPHSFDVKLQEAYEILETSPGATVEEVRKQWKKLSLRYHPDRNPGNEQAHHMQQKVNEAFQRIQMALEEANDPPADDDDNSDHSEEETTFHRPPPPSPTKSPEQEPQQQQQQQQQQQPKYRKSKKKHQSRRQEEAAMKRRREELRKELERELQREEREKKEKYQTVHKEKHRIRRETIRLADQEQREAASRLFMDQVHLRQEQFQQQQQQQQPSYSFADLGPCQDKPKNYIMESCTNELVLAMRLEMDEFAAEILDDQINASIQWHLHNPMFLMKAQKRRGFVTFEQILSLVMPKILLQRLDEDHNTVLHYALYWERPTMVQVFCDLANRHGILEKVILAKNIHGHVAMDLAWVAKNPYLLSLMQSQQTLLQMQKERTQIGPALKKAAKQLWIAIRDHFDAIILLNSCLAFAVGVWGLSMHWIIACMSVAALQSPQSFSWMVDPGRVSNSTNLAFFLSFLIWAKLTWFSTLWCYHSAANAFFSLLTWQLLLLLIPAGILCGCTGSWVSLDLLRALMFFWRTCFETLLYLPLLELELLLFNRSWKQIPTSIRKRPAMIHALILFGMLVATALTQRIFGQ